MITNFNEFRKINENEVPRGPLTHSMGSTEPSNPNAYSQDEIEKITTMISGARYFPTNVKNPEPSTVTFSTEDGSTVYTLVKHSNGYTLDMDGHTYEYKTLEEFESATADNGDNDLDPAGGYGLHSHESRKVNESTNQTMITKINDFKNKMINEGALKRHWEEILSAVEGGTELSYLSNTDIHKSVPVAYYNNVVTFANGVNILDTNVETSVNKLKITEKAKAR